MLIEMQCDKFATQQNGVFVARDKIIFKEGLNTVLGDKKAENSIGKSTVLLAVDFCFGGNDYVNPGINNSFLNQFVGEHTIKFAFKFEDGKHYFCRNTKTPYEVGACDENYELDHTITLDEFKKFLAKQYKLTDGITFRDALGPYFRIYGRENYDERHPLKYGDIKEADSIKTLEKLFDVYAAVESYEKEYEARSKQKKLRNDVSDPKYGIPVNIARTQKEVKDNEEEIVRLETELENLTDAEDNSLADADMEKARRAAEIKSQLAVLRRRRTRLLSQQESVKKNMEGGQIPTATDIDNLASFFPGADVERITKIEEFHQKMQVILSDEMSDEVAKLETLIEAVNQEMKRLEFEQRLLGIPTNVSKKYIDKVIELNAKINALKQANEGYRVTKEVESQAKAAKEELEKVRTEQLDSVERDINRELLNINQTIYNGTRYEPRIKFSNAKSGNPKYDYCIPEDKGAGTNFKNMIMFDLSLMNITQLPALAHDSNIFKNVADLPIDQFMELYKQSKKQIFIAFDKKDAFSDTTRKIVEETTVIELYDNGGELYGWSWGKKPAEKTSE